MSDDNVDIMVGQFTALFGKQEELHPDLEGHIYPMTSGMDMIHHPRLIAPMYSPSQNALYNVAYATVSERIEKALVEENWDRYVFSHERPYRVSVFRRLLADRPDIERELLIPLLSSVWIDSENVNETKDDWDMIWGEFEGFDPIRLAVCDEDRKTFEELPEIVTVYRGYNEHSEGQWESYSWTLKIDTATFFAKRLASRDATPTILTGTVRKSDILAVFTVRGESEITVRSGSVSVVSEKPI